LGPYFCAKYPFLFIHIVDIVRCILRAFLPPTRAIAKARGPKIRSEMHLKISHSGKAYHYIILMVLLHLGSNYENDDPPNNEFETFLTLSENYDCSQD
jgi:hypothetical protein